MTALRRADWRTAELSPVGSRTSSCAARPSPVGAPFLAFLAVLLAMAEPSEVLAQERWTVDGSAGIAVPVGDLSDYHDLGAALEAGLSYRLSPRFRARLLWSYHPLPGSDWDNVEPVEWSGQKPQGPEGRFHYFLVGTSFLFSEPTRAGWNIDGFGGVGAAYMDLEETEQSAAGTFVRPATGGGVELSYPLHPRIRLLGRSAAIVILRDFDGGTVGGRFAKEITFSYSAGIRFSF